MKSEDLDKKKKEVKSCAKILLECISVNNLDISETLDALQLVYAGIMLKSGLTCKEYIDSMNSMRKGYKKLWDEHGN